MTQPLTTDPPTLFDGVTFDDSFVRLLPGDPSEKIYPRQVLGSCYSRVSPTPVADPQYVAHAAEVAERVGLGGFDPDDPKSAKEFAEVFAGNRLVDGMDPYAACYGGHQFGHWAGQLGDGRAITLGEVVTSSAGESQRYELQLKGAGPTPYSRTADGRAVLRSSIREFLCSEAMHHLGVPTTRALSLVTSGDAVMRDMFYDGRAAPEPGAVVCRVAPSFLRFGNFEIFAARDEVPILRQLADYAIRTHFPHLIPSDLSAGTTELPSEILVEWLRQICRDTAEMIAHWMRVGFVHGVMNTDNMSILGLTIDYGPYGWLDDYDPNWTPNTTDAQGRRYRFGNQPAIAEWNLARFAESLHPLIGEVAPLEDALALYRRTFQEAWQTAMAGKLGLDAWRPGEGNEGDASLVKELLEVLQATETDMTLFYRRLSDVPLGDKRFDQGSLEPLVEAYYDPEEALSGTTLAKTVAWLERYRKRLATNDISADERQARMRLANPKLVLRNYLAQLAIRKAEEGDPSAVRELLEAVRHPYDDQPQYDHLVEKRPEWARNEPGCSMLSCSS